jgi:phospholipid/cholesterol/gamma-HCH transport system substrate-binding protein
MVVMIERDPRFTNIDRKVGAFLLLALVGAACVVFFVGLQQDLFRRSVGISFVADSGKDLREGQTVEFRGFKIGKVRRVLLNEEGQVEVDLAIQQRYMKWIRQDSRVRLVKDMLIGDGVLDILPGELGRQELREGGRIRFEREKGLGELLGDLKMELTPVIEDVKRIINGLGDPQGDLRVTLANIRAVTDYLEDPGGDLKKTVREFHQLARDLPETREKALRILTEMSSELADVTREIRSIATLGREEVLPEIKDAVAGLRSTASGAEETLKMLRQDLPGIIGNLNRTLNQVEAITKDLKGASPHLESLVVEVEGTSREARRTLESIRDLWFLRTAPEGPRQRVLKVDSHE